jgi:hypothetical protein
MRLARNNDSVTRYEFGWMGRSAMCIESYLLQVVCTVHGDREDLC